MPVEGSSSAVVAHRGPRVGVRRCFLDVSERDAGVDRGHFQAVAQRVRADALVDPGGFRQALRRPSSLDRLSDSSVLVRRRGGDAFWLIQRTPVWVLERFSVSARFELVVELFVVGDAKICCELLNRCHLDRLGRSQLDAQRCVVIEVLPGGRAVDPDVLVSHHRRSAAIKICSRHADFIGRDVVKPAQRRCRGWVQSHRWGDASRQQARVASSVRLGSLVTKERLCVRDILSGVHVVCFESGVGVAGVLTADQVSTFAVEILTRVQSARG